MSLQKKSGLAAAMRELRIVAAVISRLLRLWYPRSREVVQLVDVLD